MTERCPADASGKTHDTHRDAAMTFDINNVFHVRSESIGSERRGQNAMQREGFFLVGMATVRNRGIYFVQHAPPLPSTLPT